MNQDEAIRALMQVGESHNHKNERIPQELASRLSRSYLLGGNGYGPGLMAMFVGCANWGVDWTIDPPEDPADKDWKGTGRRSGKHINDGGNDAPYGGIGIVHLDSSGLYKHCYRKWGEPYDGAMEEKLHFNAALKSEHREDFLAWADKVLRKESFHFWLIEYWLRKFWLPAWKWARNLSGRPMSERVEMAAVNARIANSLQAVDDPLRDGMVYVFEGKRGRWVEDDDGHITIQEQVDSYVNYRHYKRGQKSAERSLRQANQARRVGAIFNALYVAPY